MKRYYDYDEIRGRTRGLVLNLPAPFKGKELALDTRGLARNIEFYLQRGVKVLMLTYGTSEFQSLDDEEIAQMTRSTVEAARGEALVIAATGRWHTRKAIEFALFCEELGADCLMATKYPELFGSARKNQAVLEYHQEIARRTRIPIMYHDEGGPDQLELVKRVAELPHVVSLKRELCELTHYHTLCQSVGDRVAVIAGAGSLVAYLAVLQGAVGALTGIGQWNPESELKFMADLLSGRMAEARRHVDRSQIFRREAARVNNAAAIKHMMDVVGLAAGPLRPPGINLTQEEKDRLVRAAREAGLLPLR